jgi:hypothetical protein
MQINAFSAFRSDGLINMSHRASEESPMRYVVRFMKDVLGNNGHQVEICQNRFEVEARDKRTAVELAKQRFCVEEQLTNWTNHADRIQVGEVELSS